MSSEWAVNEKLYGHLTLRTVQAIFTFSASRLILQVRQKLRHVVLRSRDFLESEPLEINRLYLSYPLTF